MPCGRWQEYWKIWCTASFGTPRLSLRRLLNRHPVRELSPSISKSSGPDTGYLKSLSPSPPVSPRARKAKGMSLGSDADASGVAASRTLSQRSLRALTCTLASRSASLTFESVATKPAASSMRTAQIGSSQRPAGFSSLFLTNNERSARAAEPSSIPTIRRFESSLAVTAQHTAAAAKATGR